MVMRLFDRMLPYMMAARSPTDLAQHIELNQEYLRHLVGALESGSGKKAREVVVGHFDAAIEELKDA